jgi:TRAP-type C4-dicarboxylate transport system substrate-binding protein
MKKGWIGFAATMFSLVMCSGISWSQTVTLKYGTPEPPQAWAQVNVVLPFLERVEKDSGGTVNFEKFMGGTIGRDVTKYTQHIKDGVINLAWIFNVYQPGRFPDDAVFNVPFTANDPFEATMAMNSMVEAGLLRGYDEFVPLALFGLNQFTIHATFPVRKPTDLKGRKLRVAGKMQQALYEALGGTPVGIAINESAEAISKGVVEGIITE